VKERRKLPGGGRAARRGIIAKRVDSPYRRGRTSDWIKVKTAAGKEIDAERAK